MGEFHLTLRDLYNKCLPSYNDKVAVKFEGEEMTYRELNKKTNQLAHALKSAGVEVEGKVALLMSNGIEFIVSDLAVMKAGATKIALNNMLGKQEIQYILADSSAQAIIVEPQFYPIMLEISKDLPDLKTIIGVSEDVPNGFTSLYRFMAEQRVTEPDVEVKPDHIAAIAYTGGTTGKPKGVVHTQHNQVLNLCCHMIELGIDRNERLLIMTPLPHSAGRYVLTGLLKGAYHVVCSRFNEQAALELIEKEQITFTFMVPTMIYRVLDMMKTKSFNTSSLQTIIYGAAPITEERLKEGLTMFGQVFYQFYGLTEAPNFITRLRKEDHTLDSKYRHRLRSCGQASIMSEVVIVDDQGNEVPRGEQGEISVKSPFIMERYYKLPEKTNETIQNGRLHTGDIGKMDEDGYVYILDRKKDMIISGGMNVYSSEVENVLVQHPRIRQAAVIGVPHSDWGEQVLAVIIPDENDSPTEQELHEFASEYLGTYKRPKVYKMVNQFPLTPYGKIDKKELRKPYWSQVNRLVN